MARRTTCNLLASITAAALVLPTFLATAQAQKVKETGALAKPAAAKETAGWSVRCNDAGQGLVCKATQSIALAKTRQLLLSVAVSKPAKGENAAILLQLPHGLFNPAGVTVGIDDGAAETLVIQTCDAKGCYAGAQLVPNKLAAMTKGTKLNVVFQNLKKQKITVPVPLKGFDAAFKKL